MTTHCRLVVPASCPYHFPRNLVEWCCCFSCGGPKPLHPCVPPSRADGRPGCLSRTRAYALFLELLRLWRQSISFSLVLMVLLYIYISFSLLEFDACYSYHILLNLCLHSFYDSKCLTPALSSNVLYIFVSLKLFRLCRLVSQMVRL